MKRLLLLVGINLLIFSLDAQLPYSWQFIYGSSNHIYIVMETASLQINGNPIETGDYIGAFYDSSGVMKCAGYVENTGLANNIAVWADDGLTPNKDGFINGELVNWRFWDTSEGEEYAVTIIAYDPSPWFSDGMYFMINAMSGIDTLHALGPPIFVPVIQSIYLPNSWSIFSTYIQPAMPNIADVISPVLPNLVIVKNGVGQSYWPQYGVNLIGNIAPGQGYQIKMSNVDTLVIEGSIIQPDTTQLIIPNSWSILGYLRTSPAPIVGMLSPIVANIIIVKSGNGLTYWPQYGVNMIGDMNPGEGYQIKMLAQDTLIYPGNPILGTIIIDTITSIVQTTAVCESEIISDGGSTITARGVCWNTSGNPSLMSLITIDGSGSGYFTSSISGLSPLNTYYVRAYATNSIGTAYSSEYQFITLANLPSVYTYPISNINPTMAMGGGMVTGSGGVAIAARGVCWNTTGMPTITDSITVDGTGIGNFSSSLYGLTPGSPYFVRAYATNSAGTGYGDETQFTTLSILPTVTTTIVSNITQTTAVCGGDVISNGGASVTTRGVCWNKTGSPSISDSITTDGTGSGIFLSNLTGLIPNTTYYLRSYASNSVGTSYGPERQFTTEPIIFSCGDQLADFDNNLYNTTQIGNQCWMAANLKTSHFADGTAIPFVVGNSNWANLWEDKTVEAYSFYNDSSDLGNTYGALYSFGAAIQGSSNPNLSGQVLGACPYGWHVPGDEEWQELELYLGMDSYDVNNTGWRGTNQGGKLKETGILHWFNPNTGATDSVGFTALPGGTRTNSIGQSSRKREYAYFWTSTPEDNYLSFYRSFKYTESAIYRNSLNNSSGHSVRCVLDSVLYYSTHVITKPVYSITKISAITGGEVIDQLGNLITSRGICWNTTGSPSVFDSISPVGNGVGAFPAYMTNLIPNTCYFLRAYATHVGDTMYGNEIQFTTLDSLAFSCGNQISDHDGNQYNTVQIGDQCWMKENLKSIHYFDGTSMVDGANAGILSWDYTTKFAFDYNNDSTNSVIYGKLYTWPAVMNDSVWSATSPTELTGICPYGWHVPSDPEWIQLIDYLGGELIAGGKMKKAGYAFWNSPNTGATNSSGFTGLPGGYRIDYNALYGAIGNVGSWWSCSESSPTNVYCHDLSRISAECGSFTSNKNFGYSVRCILNTTTQTAFLPTVTTQTVSGLSDTTATCGGIITNDGGAAVTEYGLCWNAAENPSINDFHTPFGSGLGSFSYTMNNLIPHTTYYVRAYATNSQGTMYGQEQQFTTPGLAFVCGSQMNDIDWNVYNTVQIGNQCWMKENLRTTHYSNGAAIPLVTDGFAWVALGNNNTGKGYCYYNNDSSLYAATYGALYTWAAAMNGQPTSNAMPSGRRGACPVGWHLPSDDEWKELEIFLGMSYTVANLTGYRGTNEGGKLKESGTTHWLSPNTGASNSSNFTALPAGDRSSSYYGSFFSQGSATIFHTSTQESATAFIDRTLSKDFATISRGSTNKSSGYSIRCLKD